MTDHILTLNAGSSSVKFALFVAGQSLCQSASGAIEGLGSAPHFHFQAEGAETIHSETDARDHKSAIHAIVNWLDRAFPDACVTGVGHRVVHGGLDFAAPVVITPEIVAKLLALAPLAPLHQPHNLAGVEAALEAFPSARQVACFDTAFHHGHDFVNEAYALPREYYDRGLRRFGFHGLSYEYIAQKLAQLAPDLASGRVVVAHLGAGASLCAIRNGRSVASTMGFSALEGLPMGTRCGSIDPGLLIYLMEHDRMTAQALTHLLYQQAGLKGLSGISGDMRQLESSDTAEAKDAIAYFAHRIRIEIAGMTAALGGLDALVFTAGIGEHSARLRASVLEGMAWLGLTVDPQANSSGRLRISRDGALPVLVIPTDEERMIAQHVIDALKPLK